MAAIRQAVRIAAAIFLLVALALVGAGTGVCLPVPDVPGGPVICSSASFPIGDWKNADLIFHSLGRRVSTIAGQYFVFSVSLLLLVATIVVIVTIFLGVLRNETTVFIFALVGAILSLINSGVEGYYAVGWAHPIYDESWIAATAFYTICTLLYGVDAILTKRSGI